MYPEGWPHVAILIYSHLPTEAGNRSETIHPNLSWSSIVILFISPVDPPDPIQNKQAANKIIDHGRLSPERIDTDSTVGQEPSPNHHKQGAHGKIHNGTGPGHFSFLLFLKILQHNGNWVEQFKTIL